MKFFFRNVLPFLLLLFLNFFVVKYAFVGMTMANDLTFMLGVISLVVLVSYDGYFIATKIGSIFSRPPTSISPTNLTNKEN
jgi:hypothetical protein